MIKRRKTEKRTRTGTESAELETGVDIMWIKDHLLEEEKKNV